jgi:hypothetical protein
MKTTILAAAAAITFASLLGGCVTTNTVPIAPDTFRLDTDSSGYLYAGNAGEETLLKAAQITQSKGFAYFMVLDGNSGNGSVYTGSTASVYGGSIFSSPTYAPTQNVSVTVRMLPQPEQGSWSVADVIAKKGKMF